MTAPTPSNQNIFATPSRVPNNGIVVLLLLRLWQNNYRKVCISRKNKPFCEEKCKCRGWGTKKRTWIERRQSRRKWKQDNHMPQFLQIFNYDHIAPEWLRVFFHF